MRNIFIIAILFLSQPGLWAQPKFEPTNASPGEFSRAGFLPRGMSMGNAASAITSGNLSAYYNPALSVFQEESFAQASYTFLALDRNLNFLNFTRKFEFGNKTAGGPPKATAGLSVGIINSGVSNIDGRDNQGFKTGTLSTSENLLFFAFANKFSDKVALGFGVRIYYYRLYDKINTTATGFDLGVIYTVSDNLRAAFVLQDLNSQYKWDTSPIYNTDGMSSINKFPTTKKIAVSYNERNIEALLAGELEFNSYGRKLLRIGIEKELIRGFHLRAGLDNIVLNNKDELMQPTAGIGIVKNISGYTLIFDYAFVVEQYSQTPRHSIGVGINY